MNFLKKAISIAFIAIIALVDVKIVIDYEIIRPTEKYNMSTQTKTVAKVLDLDTIHPEEITSSEEQETEQEEQQEISEENSKNEEPDLKEQSETKVKDGTESDEASFGALASALSANDTVVSGVNTYQLIEPIKENDSEEKTQESSNSDNIVETAKSYIGSNYVSGGSSPETGFDCSGFTQYIYGLYGISLNRVAADQADNGTPISKEELRPGDLVLFSYYGSDSIGHTGIYIGDGQFVHAANSSRGVVTDTLESGYYLDNYVSARRF